MDRSQLAKKAADEFRERTAAAAMMRSPRRTMWPTAFMWMAGGAAMAWLAAFFFDGERGAARRHMAYDKAMATGRDAGRWSGKKARHMRNKAQGAVAEMKGPAEDSRPAAQG